MISTTILALLGLGYSVGFILSVLAWPKASPRGRRFLPLLITLTVTWMLFYFAAIATHGIPPFVIYLSRFGNMLNIVAIISATVAIRNAGTEQRREAAWISRHVQQIRRDNASTVG